MARYAHAVLGACLTADGKYAEAETQLLAAHQCLAANREPIAPGFQPILTDIDRWTAELYEAWGKPEQATKWRKKVNEGQRQGR